MTRQYFRKTVNQQTGSLVSAVLMAAKTALFIQQARLNNLNFSNNRHYMLLEAHQRGVLLKSAL